MVVMWSIRSIKKEGWNKLKKRLGGAILLTLVFFVIALVTQLPNEFSGYLRSRSMEQISAMQASGTVTMEQIRQVMGGMWSQTGWTLLSLLLIIFVLNPVMIGYFRWFLSNSHEAGTPRLSQLFYSFQTGIYKPILCGTLFKALWVTIWRIVAGLFYIPFYISIVSAIISVARNAGNFVYANDPQKFLENFNYFLMGNIYEFMLPLMLYILGAVGFCILMLNRLYAYYFVEFILADNPTIGARNAMKRSKQMTYGIKKTLFLFELSYIGWWVLAILTLGLLSFGIIPYTMQARSELYLKRKAESRFF